MRVSLELENEVEKVDNKKNDGDAPAKGESHVICRSNTFHTSVEGTLCTG
jgi:hypothetical protein